VVNGHTALSIQRVTDKANRRSSELLGGGGVELGSDLTLDLITQYTAEQTLL